MSSQPQNRDEDKRRYENPAEGLKALEASYEYWTSKITEVSFQCCIALIAANWAVHSKSGALLDNSWAVASVVAALATVLVSLVGALAISERAHSEFYVAVGNRKAWTARWEASERIDSEWPFTKTLGTMGRTFTWMKAILPVVSGALFLVGTLSTT